MNRREAIDGLDNYSVHCRDAAGRFVSDPHADYRHAGALPLREPGDYV